MCQKVSLSGERLQPSQNITLVSLELSCIPVEVLDSIVQHLPQADWASLSTPTSTLMNELTTRQLYRYIIIRSPRQLVRCYKSLLCNTTASAGTRTLFFALGVPFPRWVKGTTQIYFVNIYSTSSRDGERFSSYCHIITRALHRTCHLRELRLIPINGRIDHYLTFLDEVFLPDLSFLGTFAEDTSTVTKFINRHKNLKSLEMFCNRHDAMLCLPALVSFKGSHYLIPDIERSPDLRSIFVIWIKDTHYEYKNTLIAIAQTPITALTSRELFWNSGFFDALSQYPPNLTHLTLIYTNAPSKDVS